jgi:ABC-type hemin transport system ATPase subunit
LDGENAQAVLRCLKQFAENGGAVLLVTHDTNAAAQFTQRTLHLKKGKIVENSQP